MRKAFTLIEVLIVIVILGIVMGVGSVRFRDFSRKQAVIGAKRQMLGDVRGAQSDATSGRKPEGCGSLNGYGFLVTSTASPAEYRIVALCSVGATTQQFVMKEVDLPVGITLTRTFPSGLTPANTIVFKALAQGTNMQASSAPATVRINNQGINFDTLTITAAGEVR